MRYRVLFALLVLLLIYLVAFRKETDHTPANTDSAPKSQRASRIHLSTPRDSDKYEHELHPNTLFKPKDGIPQVHEVQHLGSFMLPQIEFHNETLSQAIDKLLYQYETACLLTGEAPIKFTYDIEGEPLGKLTLTTSGDFKTILNTIALYLGMHLTIEGNHLDLAAMPEDHTPTSKEFQLPPDFLSYFYSYQNDTPFYKLNPDEKDALFSSFSERFGDTISINWDKNASKLVAAGSQSDLNRLSGILKILKENQPIQYRASTKRISIPQSSDFDQLSIPDYGQLSQNEAQTIMRSIAQFPESDISPLPNIVTRANEPSLIEIIREIDGPTPRDWGGIKVGITAAGYGFGIKNFLTYEQRETDSFNEINHPIIITGESKIEEQTFNYTSGGILIKTHETDGHSHYVIVSTYTIDATGSSLSNHPESQNPRAPVSIHEPEIIWAED